MIKSRLLQCITLKYINWFILLIVTSSIFAYFFIIQTKFQSDIKTIAKSKTNIVLDISSGSNNNNNNSIASKFSGNKIVNQKLKTVNNEKSQSKCELISQKLIGYKPYDPAQIKADINETTVIKLLSSQEIKNGGKWSPSYCKARHHVAILIPYLNREHHLKQFLLHMHPLFARQELSYGIYVIEPVKNITFNRGILMNIGFIESNKDSNNLWQCHAYHDVDLISEDDRTLYYCPDSPTHMSYRMSKYNYKPFYDSYFGGVTLISKNKYNNSNGYSNLFFGWGGEDDDHYSRIAAKNNKILCPPEPLGRYLMMGHDPDKPNPERFKMMQDGKKRFDNEGLNTVKYEIIEEIKNPLYTKFLVYYNETELLNTNYTVAV